MAQSVSRSARFESAVAGEGGRIFEPVTITSPLHPTGWSRLAVVVAAIHLACAAFIALLIVSGEPSAIAVLLIFFGSSWIAIRIFRARLLGQCVSATGGITPARAAQARRAVVGRWSLSAPVLAVLAVVAGLALAVEPAGADTFTVDWTGDIGDSNRGDGRCTDRGSNACSLRAAIEEANATRNEDRIEFNIPGPSGTKAIQIVDSPLQGELEPIAHPLTIDGQTQSGLTGNPPIVLRGTRNLEWGLKVTGGSSVIRGLVIRNFGSDATGPDSPAEGGIVLEGGGANTIEGNFVGVGPARGSAEQNTNGVIVRDSRDNTIGGDAASERNVISGNTYSGVLIAGEDSTGNKVGRNYIGTDPRGRLARPNSDGVTVRVSAANTIGGASPSERNVISGNSHSGVAITGGAAPGNRITGNYIGTSAGGKTALGNGSFGIRVTRPERRGPSGTVIGGTERGERNVISGNGVILGVPAGFIPTEGGVLIEGGQGSRVEGNFIGTDHRGRAAVPNSSGVIVRNSRQNAIGGRPEGTRNLISGNAFSGVMITGGGATGNKISGNFIGTDVSGKARVGNGRGILLTSPEHGNPSGDTVIGGADEGEGNLISGNGDGIKIVEAPGNRIIGNLIGTDRTGRALLRPATSAGPPLGNERDGVNIEHPAGVARGTTVGGEEASARNVISGNGRDGVRIAGRLASDHHVKGNLIGTDADRKPTLGNGENGVSVLDAGAGEIVVGCAVGASESTCRKAGNTIAGNRGDGVHVGGATALGVTIRANAIFANGPGSGRRGSGGLGINLHEVGVTPAGVTANDARDRDRGPNALMNFPAGITATSAHGTTTIGGLVDNPDPDPVTVDFYASETVDPHPAFGEGAQWLGSVKVDPNTSGNFRFTPPGAHAPRGKFFSATATSANGSTSEFSAVCGDPDVDGNTDSDGDALCDDWERYGIDFNGDRKIDLPLRERPYRSDWKRKDLFVEVDYMATSDRRCPGDEGRRRLPECEKPELDALPMVQEAFEEQGINLHLSPHPRRRSVTDERVRWVHAPAFRAHRGPNGPGEPDDMWDLKLGQPANLCDGRFGTAADRRSERECAHRLGAKRLVFRYALFAHSQKFGEGEDLFGSAFQRDNDLLVTVGHLTTDDFELFGGGGGPDAGVLNRRAPRQCNSPPTCRANVEAATFMHELGHALGLDHGGLLPSDFKPNYLSVMNDRFTNQHVVPDRPLDYSRCKLPGLNEASGLWERDGIVGPQLACLAELAGLRTAFSFPSGPGTCKIAVVDATGRIDWNQKNSIEPGPVTTGIDEDVSRPVPRCDLPENRVLEGFDDWDNISYDFRDSEHFAVGPNLSEGKAEARATDADGDGVSNLTDNCNVVANPPQNDQDSDGIGDACAALVTDVNLAVAQTASPQRTKIGDEVSLLITVTNDWPLAAPGTAIAVGLPDGLLAREATASQGAFDAGSGIWSVGTLAKRGRATLTIKVHAVAPGRLVSIAEVSASGRPDRNAIPANGDPLEDDYARAVVKAVASPGAGTISTIAGRWTGPTLADRTGQGPVATAVRGSTLYVLDAQANQLKAVDLERGLERLVAGNGTPGGGGDGGRARNASLALPQGLDQSGGLVVDAANNVYIADSGNHRVRRIAANGTITTVAGTGVRGFRGDGGPATAARLDDPRGLALDSAGNLYVADSGNKRVRKIDAAGRISTSATMAREPASVALHPNGNLLVAPGPGNTVVETARNGASSIFAGGGLAPPSLVVPATSAELGRPIHVAAGPAGNVYITDNDNMRIRVVDSTGTIHTWAGSDPPRGEAKYGDFSGDNGYASNAGLSRPVGVSFDAAGNGYIADRGNHRVRRVDTNGVISTIAGGNALRRTASCCISGEDGRAASAQLGRPGGLAVAPNRNVVLVDQDNYSVHVVAPDGTIKRLGGLNRLNCACDDLPNTTRDARDRLIEQPRSVTTGANGAVYIDEFDRDEFHGIGDYGFVHRIDYHPERGDQLPVLTTVAGSGFAHDAPDGGKATEGNVRRPGGLALDRAGNLYLGETDGHRVRRITPSGVITTIAGTGTAGARGDGGRATAAQLRSPEDVEVATNGSLYVADTGNHRVRKIDASGTITTVAGTGRKGFSGDGGRAVRAKLNQPSDIALNAHGNLYLADRGNHRVRLVTATGTILTIAGTGARGIGADGGLPTGAPLDSPDGLALDHQGQLLVSAGPLVRRLRAPSGPVVYLSDVRISEGTGPDRVAKVTVSLLEPAPSQVAVRYTTADRTATAPADYAATSGVLSFRPGDTSKRVTVPIVGDRIQEKRERLEIALSEASGGAALADLVAQVSITDDD
jgi:sugar lactone lactonase YvrE